MAKSLRPVWGTRDLVGDWGRGDLGKRTSRTFLQTKKLRHEGLGRSLERLRAESRAFWFQPPPLFRSLRPLGGSGRGLDLGPPR